MELIKYWSSDYLKEFHKEQNEVTIAYIVQVEGLMSGEWDVEHYCKLYELKFSSLDSYVQSGSIDKNHLKDEEFSKISMADSMKIELKKQVRLFGEVSWKFECIACRGKVSDTILNYVTGTIWRWSWLTAVFR